MNVKENLEIASSIAQETASKVLESKTLAITVAGATTYLGLAEWQGIASLVATCIGIVLSTVLIIKHSMLAWKEWKKGYEED